ncbi:MAG: hypothetical protein ACD_62C00398G0011 [uncultured bacterium]|nr:MAG: hypothetical protein ACD_62C00398G0011 [uncultured bacterium]
MRMNRTTICLDEPILARVRARAQRMQKTLKEAIAELLLLGLAKVEKIEKEVPSLSLLKLGKERADISSRTRLYESWEEKV